MKRELGLAILVVLVVLIVLAVAPTTATAQTLDNSGGGKWKEYMSFPITVTPMEHAQYKIVINGTTWELHNATGGLEITGTNSNFWSYVNSTGADIRVFNQTVDGQLYFWIENWDYTNQTATIWVNLTPESTELNIAYGNPSATKSSYENVEQVFEFFDDFSGDLSKWKILSGTWTIEDGRLRQTDGGSDKIIQANFPNPDNYVAEFEMQRASLDQDAGFALRIQDASNWYVGQHSSGRSQWEIGLYQGGAWQGYLGDTTSHASDYNLYKVRVVVIDTTVEMYVNNNLVASYSSLQWTSGGLGFKSNGNCMYFDNLKVLKSADPADFGTPLVKLFQKQFGTKTVYVNVTYLDSNTTERYNPTAYYSLEDKPQINITSQLSVSGVNTTYGANISVELIDFVALDKVVYNGTNVTANLTYQGTITNTTTGYDYNVYNFTTYENGTLEIYGHVENKAYKATFKLDGETVDIFNVTAVVGEVLEITLPHKGNITLASIEHTNVTTVLINTKDVGVCAETLSITIEDPENFTVGYIYRTVNIDWGKINFSVTDLQNKTLAASYGFFNKNFSILSTDPSKLYAGDIEIDVYFHEVKLKSLEIHLNHTNNGLTLNVSVNATQFKDYRDVTRIVASPKYFEVVNLSTKYPFSVMKLVNVSGAVVIDFVSNAPTSVKVEGATSYSYEKAVLKITASSNVTVTDLYKLSAQLKDRLGNPVNFYVSINGSRVDASNGVVSKLLKPSWYKVEVPITVSGFELWKFNDSSNIALVEISTSDKTLPTAEYRVPSKIESKEVRLQRLSFPFLSSKPAQEETPIVRLEGTLRDFYNAPVANKTVKIEIVSPNFTRIYTLTTDESGNFKVDVDMARGVEYKVTYKFAGDDVYVGTSTTKTFTVEQLLPAPPEEIENILILIGIVIGLVAVVAGGIYLARKTKAKTLARMENEFKFFKRIK